MPSRKYYRSIIHKSQRKKRKIWLFLKIGAGLFLASLIFLGGVFVYFASQLPNPEEFESRVIKESTKIYDSSGKILLYEAGREIKRTYVTLDQISPYLQKATIAAEDANFYNHPGIDIKATIRALIYDILHLGKKLQGGSTITQQFIKNAMLTPERTISRKIKEIILALELERRYSKDKILEFYLNQVSYGSVFYGVESASRYYFGKSAKDLTLAEAASLAALTRSPTFYLQNEEAREKRKNWILDRMVKLGFISKSEAEKAKKKKIKMEIKSEKMKAPYFVNEVKKILEEKYGEDYQLMGLKVYTTLNYKLQTLAEKVIKEWSKKIEKWYGASNAALVALDPKTGNILAMVGGRDFKETQVNIWTPEIGKSFQSPGSAFKPIVYASAFKKGYTPNTIIWDVKTDFFGYSPDNYDFKERGPVKMKEALAQSLNIPAVKTLYLAGIEDTIFLAKGMGMIKSFDPKLDPTKPNLSMAIGGKGVVPLELVSAFSVFANEGIRHLPNYILKIEDSKGKIIYEAKSQGVRVLDEEICRQINAILSDNSLRAPMFGRRSWLYLNSRTAVKTGTAATRKGKVTDVWTIGYTKNLVAGVWVGNNDETPMRGRVAGATAAAPIWWNFMKKAEKEFPKERFTPPKKIWTGKFILDGYLPKKKVKIDKISGKLATKYTPSHLIVEKEFYVAHSILYWVNKDDPRGPYPTNPYLDPMFKKWESAVQAWVKKVDDVFSLPTEKDDIHTKENRPKIEIISKELNEEEGKISFSVKLTAPLGIKKVEVYLKENQKLLLTKTDGKTEYTFSFSLEELGESEKYTFVVKVQDKVENENSKEISF